MGSELSTQGNNQKDPPTPSTVKSLPDEISAAVRSPPIDASQGPEHARVGRLSRFLSDAMPSSRGSAVRPPIPQEIHVVNEGNLETLTVEQDPDMRHMLSLPSFLPIVKSSVNMPSTKDPEVCDRLDYRKILMLGLRYQQYLRQCSDLVTVEQQTIMSRIKEVDQKVAHEVTVLSEKQRLLARYADTFGNITEISKTLDKLNENLSKTVHVMENLNQLLPAEYRMPAFKFND